MNFKTTITYLVFLALGSCASDGPVSGASEAKNRGGMPEESEWEPHPKELVPNVFEDRGKKKSLKFGFYEQDGTVLSNASWEAVAHYPFSISPSGRFVVIPVTYSSGEESRDLKIYDRKQNRFILRKVGGLAIKEYEWSSDDRSIVVTFENEEREEVRLAKGE